MRAALLVGLWPFAAVAGMPEMSPSAADLEAGQALYAEHCAACHGKELEGQADWRTRGADGVLPAPPHDETGHTWHHGDRVLFDYTQLGGRAALAAQGIEDFPSGMPGFGDTLTDAQIRDVLVWIKSTWPDKVRQVQAARSAAEPAR